MQLRRLPLLNHRRLMPEMTRELSHQLLHLTPIDKGVDIDPRPVDVNRLLHVAFPSRKVGTPAERTVQRSDGQHLLEPLFVKRRAVASNRIAPYCSMSL